MMRLVLAVAGAAAVLGAQQFVAEIDPAQPTVAASDARHALVVGDHVWFVARTPDAGLELHRSDGTVAGTRRVLDLGLGAHDSTTRPLAEVAGRLLFSAFDSLGNENAIWATDGTAAGTARLAVGIGEIDPVRVLGIVAGRAVFTDYRQSAWRVWSTDLTPAGTLLMGGFTGVITPAQQRGAQLLFLARGFLGNGLWSTDGNTLALLHDLGGGNASSGFARLGANDFFIIHRLGQFELVRTDGTTVGTALVAALGASIGYGGASIAAIGGLLVVSASGQLFASDGTAAGTSPIATPVVPGRLTAVGNQVFFDGYTQAFGNELWRTDGTAAGTYLVSDSNPAFGGAGGSRHELLTDVQGRLFCFVMTIGWHLLTSDGTPAGTQLLPVLTDPMYWALAAKGTEAIATFGLTPFAGMELFATDGTLAGSRQLTANRSFPGAQETGAAAALGETLYFVARDAAHGRELWRTDGTSAGTALVQDLVPGPADGVREVVEFEDRLYFGSGPGELWRSDGTAVGTVFVTQPAPGANSLGGFRVRNGTLLFVTSGPGAQLWSSDGTAVGTNLLATAPLGILGYEVAGSFVFYLSTDLAYRTRLFRTDGTPFGTLDLGPARTFHGVLGDRLVFSAAGIGTAIDLFVTDGTLAGTQRFHTGSAPSAASAQFGGRLFWTTSAGQVQVTDAATVTTLPVPRTIQTPVAGSDGVYLVTEDPLAGRVLFGTDGTAAGTVLVAGFGLGPIGGARSATPIAAGNRLFVVANDTQSGVEPWISDGTTAGTRLLAALHPTGNSNPQFVGVAGARAYFTAEDGVRGRELWKVDLAAIGAANAQPFGVGCPGSAGTPRLSASGIPVTGAMAFGLELRNGRPLAATLWLAGFAIGNAPLGGPCALTVANPVVLTLSLLDPAGAGGLPLPVPANPALVGMTLMTQALVIDAQGASPLGLSTSQGLMVVLGG